MSDTQQPACPQCGAPLPASAPARLCPRCLMAMNLATQTAFTGEDAEASASQKSPPPSLEEIARHFPNLEILECLGRGGMGVVYKARQKSLNRLVALKILAPEREKDPTFAQRFAVEAETLAKLNHPGIVTLYEFGVASGILPDATPQLYFFLMEYVDGVTLRQLLNTGRISAREALAIVPQICDALQFAHDHGIVHRDIKPENILMDRRGRVMVADFGLAKFVGTDGWAELPLGQTPQAAQQRRPTSELTEIGKVMGTPQYMSPEQMDNPGEVDHRADIYALGVVFYQMLTGELPGKKLEPPSSKVQIDVRLDEVVLRALEKNPQLRYQQASVFKTEVETIAETRDDRRRRGDETQTEKGKAETTPPKSNPFGLFAQPTNAFSRAIDWSWRLLFVLFVVVLYYAGKESKAWNYWETGFTIFLILSMVELLIRLRRERKAEANARSGQREAQTEKRKAETRQTETNRGENSKVPWRLIVVAVLFFISGLRPVWELGKQIAGGSFQLSLGLLGIPIGVGLLRLRPWWRKAVVAYLLFMVAFLFVAGVLGLAGMHLNVPTFNLFGFKVENPFLRGVAMIGIIVLLGWMYGVLIRPDVKILFEKKGFDRPLMEWAVLLVVLAIFAGGFALFGEREDGKRLSPASFSAPLPRSPHRMREVFNAPFVAALRNGGIVELLAVRRNEFTNEPWWQPNGLPSNFGSDIQPASQPRHKEGVAAIVRVDFPHHYDSWPRANGVWGNDVTFKNGLEGFGPSNQRLSNDLLAMYFDEAPSDGDETALLLKAAVEWQPLITVKPGFLRSTVAPLFGSRWRFSETMVGDLKVRNAAVIVDSNHEYRLAAVDVDGKAYLPNETSQGSAGTLSPFEAQFKGLPFKGVREVRWEARPYETLEFRHVSLKPSHRTTVEIKDFGEVSSNRSTEDQIPKPLTFGPVIQRVITDISENPAQACLDFSTGMFCVPSRTTADWLRRFVTDRMSLEIKSSGNELFDWLKSNQVDLIGCRSAEGGALFKLLGEPPSCRMGDKVTFDSVQLSEVTQLLKAPSAYPDDDSHFPVMHFNAMELDQKPFSNARFLLFRTFDGDAGVMEVLGPSDNPRGVKIRYKLVQAENK
ncbi:MAG: protein kinase [Akkermansiaceae bacterium]|nr:protein kinase [Verrucomicrobiales bacterium]